MNIFQKHEHFSFPYWVFYLARQFYCPRLLTGSQPGTKGRRSQRRSKTVGWVGLFRWSEPRVFSIIRGTLYSDRIANPVAARFKPRAARIFEHYTRTALHHTKPREGATLCVRAPKCWLWLCGSKRGGKSSPCGWVQVRDVQECSGTYSNIRAARNSNRSETRFRIRSERSEESSRSKEASRSNEASVSIEPSWSEDSNRGIYVMSTDANANAKPSDTTLSSILGLCDRSLFSSRSILSSSRLGSIVRTEYIPARVFQVLEQL